MEEVIIILIKKNRNEYILKRHQFIKKDDVEEELEIFSPKNCKEVLDTSESATSKFQSFVR